MKGVIKSDIYKAGEYMAPKPKAAKTRTTKKSTCQRDTAPIQVIIYICLKTFITGFSSDVNSISFYHRLMSTMTKLLNHLKIIL